MLLPIHDNLLISQMQERFSKSFPCLKIEFYTKAHHVKEESPEKFLLTSDKTIGQIRKKRKEGTLEIKSIDTVAHVEKDFEQYGLHVQVFRRENGSWVQTSKTDKYTLLEQNEMALHSDSSFSLKCKEQLGEYDYL